MYLNYKCTDVKSNEIEVWIKDPPSSSSPRPRYLVLGATSKCPSRSTTCDVGKVEVNITIVSKEI